MTLEDLPEQLATIGASIAAGASAIDRVSAALPEDRVLLRRAGVRLRLSFANQDAHTVLFFFRTAGDTYVPVDAAVNFDSTPDANGRGYVPAVIPRRVALPPFFAEDLTDDDVARFGPPGATRDNTIFLSIGDSLLAIKDAGRSVRYSRAGVPGVVESRRVGLAPFVDLLFALRDWVSNDVRSSVLAPLGPSNGSGVHRILDSLVEGYARTAEALGSYRLSGFSSAVRLRLDGDGEIAARASDEAFQLAIRMNVDERGAEMSVAPPDLVADGPLRDAFLNELAYDPPARRALARLLGCFEVQVPSLIDSARNGAIAMRVGREGACDRELLWLPGTDRNLLLTAVFHVDLRAEPRVTLDDAQSVDALSDPVDAAGVAHFFRLIAGMRSWVNLLR